MRETEGLSRLHNTITDWPDWGYTRSIAFMAPANCAKLKTGNYCLPLDTLRCLDHTSILMSILRKWFGPSKEEIWRQLSTQIGGNFEPGGFWRNDKLHAAHREWVVTLDHFTQVVSTGKTTTVVHHTRMRAPYVNKDGFRFNIYRRRIFSDVGKFFGMQDVEVGHEEFDHDFIIKGNDEAKLRALFANPRIRELVAAQKTIHFCVKDDEGTFKVVFPEGVDELQFDVVGIIKDIERLKLLFDLFAETLDELCRIGSAYERSPNVTL